MNVILASAELLHPLKLCYEVISSQPAAGLISDHYVKVHIGMSFVFRQTSEAVL